jgi:hypothetical protein
MKGGVMAKVDLKKELKELYNPSAKAFSIVDVPPMSFLMVDGHGDPNTSPAYQQAMEALYSVAYAAKFALKPQGIDYAVMPLEGLWWMEDMAEFSLEAKDRWDWTMMIAQPEWVTAELVERVRGQVARKKDLPALPALRLETYHEGLAAQILYFGAYADEGPTIARLHAFIEAQGYERSGKHHEVYLGDPRRTPPEKLKTVIRQPMRERSS